MRRQISLRQVEAFKAVMEHGSISVAAEVLRVSQPAVSKMIAHLEADTELALFERVKGRLAATERGLRLYDEIDRIFSGVQQVENAIDAIRRLDQGRIAIGVLPALSGSFIQQVTMAFLAKRPQAFCSVESFGSQRIVEALVARKLDVGLISADVDNPYLSFESLMKTGMVCILPPGHALAGKRCVRAGDLDDVPFVSFDPETLTAQRIAAAFTQHQARHRIVLVTNHAPTLCEYVAAGLGVAVVHPLMAKGYAGRLVVRPFEPEIPLDFRLGSAGDTKNADLVAEFIDCARETARKVMREPKATTPPKKP